MGMNQTDIYSFVDTAHCLLLAFLGSTFSTLAIVMVVIHRAQRLVGNGSLPSPKSFPQWREKEEV